MAKRPSDDDSQGRLATLAVLALVVGAAAGLIGAVFRIVLVQADAVRDRVLVWAHGEALWGFAAVVLFIRSKMEFLGPNLKHLYLRNGECYEPQPQELRSLSLFRW